MSIGTKFIVYFIFLIIIFGLVFLFNPMLNLVGFIGGIGSSLIEFILPCFLFLKLNKKSSNCLPFLILCLGELILVSIIVGTILFHQYQK